MSTNYSLLFYINYFCLPTYIKLRKSRAAAPLPAPLCLPQGGGAGVGSLTSSQRNIYRPFPFILSS